MSGLDALLALPHLPCPGARVGFLGHHASVDRAGVHALERLRARDEWQLKSLFSPEHGFFGKAGAGERVQNQQHPQWQLPVFSLYGENRSPLPLWLEGLDLLVIDLQDLGVRCYTYASTLLLMLRACAKAALPVWVLDRPTPLAGIIDGPGLDPALESFVGMIDLPLVFGRGQGDLAAWLHGHDSECRKLDLRIFRDSEPVAFPPWIPPSPGIVSRESSRLYPVTVWSEAIADVQVDRGGTGSFQMWCMPDFPDKLIKTPPAFEGMTARPVHDQKWPGLRFQISDPAAYRPVENALRLLCALRDALGSERLFAGEGTRPDFFDQLMGNRTPREQIMAGLDADAICAAWKT